MVATRMPNPIIIVIILPISRRTILKKCVFFSFSFKDARDAAGMHKRKLAPTANVRRLKLCPTSEWPPIEPCGRSVSLQFSKAR